MKKICILASIILPLFNVNAKDVIDYVNPNMGGISHTLKPTYPTVQLPNSMLRVFPRRNDFTDMQIDGLPICITSHRNAGSKALEVFVGNNDDSKFDLHKYFYDAEELTPYSYKVFIEKENVAVKFAPSTHSAIYEFDFSQSKDDVRNIKLRLKNGKVYQKNNAIILEENLSKDVKMYVFFEFDKAPIAFSESKNGKSAIASFDKSHKKICAKYAVSFISLESAQNSLKIEIPEFDIAKVIENGRKTWNEKLSKIEVTGDENHKQIFYTSLWRTYERMIDISEYGKHLNPANAKVVESQKPFYTDDWIWDTYRTTHPLRLLIEENMERDMLNSYLEFADTTPEKWMPTFPQITGDAHAMNGNHATLTFADAQAKGLVGVDYKLATHLIKNTLETETITPWVRAARNELDDFYELHGFFPALANGEHESVGAVNKFERRQSVATTLAACYDDWALSSLAKNLGDENTSEKFAARSKNYKNLFNPQTKFFHPKDSKGKFLEYIDYRYAGGIGFRDYYDENNAFTYRFDVAFDVEGLVDLFGSKDEFESKLDELFITPLGKWKYDFLSQNGPDHTACVGQFSMGNEPSLHIPYLYNFTNSPYKTQKMTRLLCDMWFRNDLMGVPGDEDGGAMSAFVVFTQLGFYPVNVGKAEYQITSPIFDEANIALSNGKVLKIKAENNSHINKYIQSATLNGKALDSTKITHSQIMQGGELVLKMGARPAKNSPFGIIK